MSAIADSMEKNGLPESAEYIRNKLDHDIKLCMVDICKVSTIEFLFYELFLTMHDDGYSGDVSGEQWEVAAETWLLRPARLRLHALGHQPTFSFGGEHQPCPVQGQLNPGTAIAR